MTTLREHEPNRDIENEGSRFWTCDLDSEMPGHDLFGLETVGIVDELSGGIVAYATEDNAAAIIDALRASLGEV